MSLRTNLFLRINHINLDLRISIYILIRRVGLYYKLRWWICIFNNLVLDLIHTVKLIIIKFVLLASTKCVEIYNLIVNLLTLLLLSNLISNIYWSEIISLVINSSFLNIVCIYWLRFKLEGSLSIYRYFFYIILVA